MSEGFAYSKGSDVLQMETANHCHVREERAWLFHSMDSGSTEDEYLQLLYALVYCLKPYSILETGAYKGMGTAYMARALKKNGSGKIFSIEIAPGIAEVAQEQLLCNGLGDWGAIVCGDSRDFLRRTALKFDFAFFDSLLPMRCEEINICLERGLLLPGSIFAIHDTSRRRTLSPGVLDPETANHWEQFERISGIKWLEFPLSRGLTLGQVL